jgi:hypothetical protein
MTVIDVAAGVLLALAVRRIAAVLVLYVWFRWAYNGGPLGAPDRALFGRFREAERLPAWAVIVRRIVEGWPRR